MDDCTDHALRVGDVAVFYAGGGLREVVRVRGIATFYDSHGLVTREQFTLVDDEESLWEVFRCAHRPPAWRLVKLEKP